MCRRWTVYRFDVYCGGVRVPWLSIAAMADRVKGPRLRAWVEDGQMHLPMPPRWSMTPDDPCARSSEYDQSWRYGRLGRYCADRRALMPPGSVEMPAGVAPVLGMDAIFVPAPPGSSDYPNAGPMPGPIAGPMPRPTPGALARPFAAGPGEPENATAA